MQGKSSMVNDRKIPLFYTLIITGDEILTGKQRDGHLPFINRTLVNYGLECLRCYTIGDHSPTLASLVRESLQDASLVIVTGGLGPTLDDITRDALSEATGIALQTDPQAMQELKDRFVEIGRPMTENNKLQALVPVSGGFFSNPNGTAPGLFFDLGEKVVVALPGPPRELEPMVLNQLVPFLQNRYSIQQAYRSSKLFFSCMGESNIDMVVRDKLGHVPDLRVSSISHLGTIDLTLSLPDRGATTLERLDQCTETIKNELGDYIYSFTTDSLPESVGQLLRERGETLAIAESCTGGLLGSQITATPGSSHYFLGGVIAYSNAIKVNILKIEPTIIDTFGAVSAECAIQMANGVRNVFNSTWGIGITGIAGPDGGTNEKPVGTVFVAVGRGEDRVYSIPLKLFGSRDAVRQRSCVYALDQLRRLLLNQKPHS